MAIVDARRICFRFQIAPFRNAGGSKASDVDTGIRISHKMGRCRQF